MSCVLLWSAIIRVAKQHISAWRAVVAVMLLGLTVVAGCDVRPFCGLGGSCSSDGTDDGGEGDCINRIGQENTIELESTPEEIDLRVGQPTDVVVEVRNRVPDRRYVFSIIKQPTSGQFESANETDPNGRKTYTFQATTPTGSTTDDVEIGVSDNENEEGCLDITIRVDSAGCPRSTGTAMGGRDSIGKRPLHRLIDFAASELERYQKGVGNRQDGVYKNQRSAAPLWSITKAFLCDRCKR